MEFIHLEESPKYLERYLATKTSAEVFKLMTKKSDVSDSEISILLKYLSTDRKVKQAQ